jgi:tyrosine-protein kinase Etk/Wzc
MDNKGLFVNKDFKLSIVIAVIKKNWFWIPILLSVAVFVSKIYLRYTKPVYESSSIIQIVTKDESKDLIGFTNPNTEKVFPQAIELLSSQFMFARAVRSLNMNVSYFSQGKFLTEEKYLQSSFIVTPYELKDSSLCQAPIYISKSKDNLELVYTHYGVTKEVPFQLNRVIENEDFKLIIKPVNEIAFENELKENQVFFTFNNLTTLTSQMLPSLTITPLNAVAKTIQISFKSNNPSLSRDVSDAMYKAFFKYDEEREKQSSQNVLKFLDHQLDSLENELERANDSLQMYGSLLEKPENYSFKTNLQERAIAFSDELLKLEFELKKLIEIEGKFSENPNRIEIYQIIPELIGYSFEDILSKQLYELHDLLEEREDLAFSVTTESTGYQKISAKIQFKLNYVVKTILAIKESVKSRIKLLSDKTSQFDVKDIREPINEREIARIMKIRSLNEKYSSMFLEKRSLYSISNAGYAATNVVLRQADVPQSPISPNEKATYSLAIVLSLIVSLAILLLRYLMYDEVNSLDDLRDELKNISILGTVPKHNEKSEFSKLVVVESPKSMIAESFRTIRSNLNFVKPDARIYAISSSISGEGKTFVCLNLAGILAMTGKRTVVLDLDLRKPKVHHGFNARNEKGMSTILSGQTKIQDCLQNSGLAELDFISAGPIPPNPSELILSDRMNETIEELKTLYDIIVIDNPPIGLVSEGIGILSMADCPIYIFKANYSKRSFANIVKDVVEKQRIKGLSVILNATDSKRNRYGYGYGYGSGYYEESKPKKKWWQIRG